MWAYTTSQSEDGKSYPTVVVVFTVFVFVFIVRVFVFFRIVVFFGTVVGFIIAEHGFTTTI